MTLRVATALLAVALMTWAAPAVCMQPQPVPVSEGFIHGSHPDAANALDVRVLPANAKGVLYAAAWSEQTLTVHPRGEHVIFRSAPAPLTPSAFTITGAPKGHAARAVVTRLDQASSLHQGMPKRYWLAKRALWNCMSGSYANRGCERFITGGSNPQTDEPGWIQRQVDAGMLVNIDREVRMASGVFRIAPAGGWRSGDTLRMVVHRPPIKYGHYAAYAPEVNVKIGSVPLDTSRKVILVAGQRERVFHPETMFVVAVDQQQVRFDLPADGPDSLMMAFIQKSGAGQAVEFVQYVHPDYQGIRRATISTRCDPGTKAMSYQLTGLAGVLEVDDRLHESAPLRIDLGDPKGCLPI